MSSSSPHIVLAIITLVYSLCHLLQGAVEEQHVVGFHMSSHEVSKRLWRSCIEHHAFFRLVEIKDFPRGGRLRSSRLRIRHVLVHIVSVRVYFGLFAQAGQVDQRDKQWRLTRLQLERE